MKSEALAAYEQWKADGGCSAVLIRPAFMAGFDAGERHGAELRAVAVAVLAYDAATCGDDAGEEQRLYADMVNRALAALKGGAA